MKKLILLFVMLGILVIPMFGQEVPVPSDWADLYENYGAFFATYLGVAGVAIFLGEYAVRLLKLAVKWQKVTVICVLAVAVSFLGNAINIGYLSEATWWETILWGGLSAATAAGLRSGNVLFIKTIVDFLIGLIKSKEPTG